MCSCNAAHIGRNSQDLGRYESMHSANEVAAWVQGQNLGISAYSPSVVLIQLTELQNVCFWRILHVWHDWSCTTRWNSSRCAVPMCIIMKNFSLWTCIFNFMNCMSNMQLERPYCMSGRQNACPCVNCMSNMQFGYSPGTGMHFGKQYTCPQGTMFLDMHIRK